VTRDAGARLRLLVLSTPVGPLGSGLGGGVELTLATLARELLLRGHTVRVVAPAGSIVPDVPVVGIAGDLQVPAQGQGRAAPVGLPPASVLAAMWEYAREAAEAHDVVVNFAYDWLPLYLTPFLRRPVAHFVSMSSLSDAMDRILDAVGRCFPGTIAAYTRTQAATFRGSHGWRCLGSGIDLRQYGFCAEPDAALAWVGRISPEKGLEDAVAVARRLGLPLRVFGKREDEAYWGRVLGAAGGARIEYQGFLPTCELQRRLGRCRALLVTPRWVEAFGLVVIEALACGVPVVAYRRGGPAEIVRDGRTGWLVPPDDVSALVAAAARVSTLDRRECRRQAESEFSLVAFGDRFEDWLRAILAVSRVPRGRPVRGGAARRGPRPSPGG